MAAVPLAARGIAMLPACTSLGAWRMVQLASRRYQSL